MRGFKFQHIYFGLFRNVCVCIYTYIILHKSDGDLMGI